MMKKRGACFIMGRRLVLAILILLVPLGAADCGGERGNPRLEGVELTITGAGKAPVSLWAELARTGEEREKGLMFRESLADGEGMLFIFERDQMLSFWMKNTLIPLSVAYIAYDGRIIEIHDMRPGDLSPVYSSRSARYALEAPQGWFDRAGVVPGDLVSIPELP
jgi:uncharacterized membrane protein (UPF0127 family)